MANDKSSKGSNQRPFFSRYLEGQDEVEPVDSARIDEPRRIGYKSKTPPLQTRKFPSDRDELNFYPHYDKKEDVPPAYRGRGKIVTLKFPSDNDEEAWCAEYTEQSAVPKAEKVKPKATTVKLRKTRKK